MLQKIYVKTAFGKRMNPPLFLWLASSALERHTLVHSSHINCQIDESMISSFLDARLAFAQTACSWNYLQEQYISTYFNHKQPFPHSGSSIRHAARNSFKKVQVIPWFMLRLSAVKYLLGYSAVVKENSCGNGYVLQYSVWHVGYPVDTKDQS